ncbi:hypothetical protein [Arthrobacter sp. D1-17]
MRNWSTILLKSVAGLVRSASGARRPAQGRTTESAPGRTTESRSGPDELTAELSRLKAQLEDLTAETAHIKMELSRLDGDLDESRRLNLRAAELLDIVYTELSCSAGSQSREYHRETPEAGEGGA